MSNHTPGPWEKCQNLVFDKNDTLVAKASRRQDGYVQANARLIAAAPELLHACKMALHWAENETMETLEDGRARIATVCRDAISKAKGDEDVSQ